MGPAPMYIEEFNKTRAPFQLSEDPDIPFEDVAGLDEPAPEEIGEPLRVGWSVFRPETFQALWAFARLTSYSPSSAAYSDIQ